MIELDGKLNLSYAGARFYVQHKGNSFLVYIHPAGINLNVF